MQDVCNKLNEHLFTTINGPKRHASYLDYVDYSDEHIVVHHTCDLTDENKAEIADCIKKILELKKKFTRIECRKSLSYSCAY